MHVILKDGVPLPEANEYNTYMDAVVALADFIGTPPGTIRDATCHGDVFADDEGTEWAIEEQHAENGVPVHEALYVPHFAAGAVTIAVQERIRKLYVTIASLQNDGTYAAAVKVLRDEVELLEGLLNEWSES